MPEVVLVAHRGDRQVQPSAEKQREAGAAAVTEDLLDPLPRKARILLKKMEAVPPDVACFVAVYLVGNDLAESSASFSSAIAIIASNEFEFSITVVSFMPSASNSKDQWGVAAEP